MNSGWASRLDGGSTRLLPSSRDPYRAPCCAGLSRLFPPLLQTRGLLQGCGCTLVALGTEVALVSLVHTGEICRARGGGSTSGAFPSPKPLRSMGTVALDMGWWQGQEALDSHFTIGST